MRLFRPPYRWLPRTVVHNIVGCWRDIVNGIRNLIEWFPVVWEDENFDWEPLARVIEFKLRRMASIHSYHVGAERDKRYMRICAELCRRMRADEYYNNAKRPGIFKNTSEQRQNWLARHAFNIMPNQDEQYLGKLLGKHLREWWS